MWILEQKSKEGGVESYITPFLRFCSSLIDRLPFRYRKSGTPLNSRSSPESSFQSTFREITVASNGHLPNWKFLNPISSNPNFKKCNPVSLDRWFCYVWCKYPVHLSDTWPDIGLERRDRCSKPIFLCATCITLSVKIWCSQIFVVCCCFNGF